MSNDNTIDFGSGRIKSDLLDSFSDEVFKDFKSGSLIITDDKSVSLALLAVIHTSKSGEDFIATISVMTTEGEICAMPVIYDSSLECFWIHTFGNRRYLIKEIIKQDTDLT